MTQGEFVMPESTPSISRQLLDQVAGLELFRSIDRALLEQLIAASEIRTVAPGAVVIEQGADNAFMYLVLEGTLAVHLGTVDDEAVARIGKGEIVGEMSVLDPGPASAWVTAAEPTRLMVMDEKVAWDLTQASHEFCLSLLRKLTSRIRNNNAAVENNARRRKAAERDANYDQLTGVANRRWLQSTLDDLFAEKTRGLCVAVVDVDHFKRFNDTFGHQAGDDVLVAVAQTIADHLRPSDHVARYGGEEFVIIFPDTYLEGAWAASERVRNAVAACVVQSSEGKELPPVTISVGIANRSAGMDPELLIARADEALYEAKHRGRNRVAIATPVPVAKPDAA